MSKLLSEMTLEELWQLFPIFLTEPNRKWKVWFEEEKESLRKIFNSSDILIHHIGSTAISNIWAKPIIDILVEIPKNFSQEQFKDLLEANHYICMAEADDRKSFNKGYTPEGFAEKVFHLHLRYLGDNDELYFRDYLNTHSDLAKEYEKLKLELWPKFEHDRDAYTEAKTEFITSLTTLAKKYNE